MFQRSTVIAALVGVEIVLLVAMVHSLHGSGSAYAHGSQSWSGGAPAGNQVRTLTSGSAPIIIVDSPPDDLTITTHDAPTVTVSAPGSDHLSMRRDGDTIRIEHDGRSHEMHIGFFVSATAPVNLVVPAAAHVTVTNATSSDITATGLRGPLTIGSTSGDIHVRDQHGDLSVDSTSGDVRLDDVDTSALTLETRNGDVTMDNVRATTFSGRTTSGDIHGTAILLHNGRIATSNGDVVLTMRHETDARFDVQTSSGDLTMTNIAASGDDHTKTARMGDATGAFGVQTTSGDISMTAEGN